jgi:transcription-repair coupling factor (superfamily II helicase)
MTDTAELSAPRTVRRTLFGVPEGHDARVLLRLWEEQRKAGHGLVHVALDDVRLARLVELIAFYAPEISPIVLPGWDCLPYDRVSPNAEPVAARIRAFVELDRAREARDAPLVLTTVSAVLQKAPPPETFRHATLTLSKGQRLAPRTLETYFARNGYTRTDTVREPGEYAQRGGILDLFPPGEAEPVRIDLFGDEIDSLRGFDPLSQTSTGAVESVSLTPGAELFLDEEAIARFRAGYREAFGAVLENDPLYEAVSEARRFAGMEHWQPLFFETMSPLLDYAPGASVSLDHQADAAIAARHEQIAEFYEARSAYRKNAPKGANDAAVYKPLPPERLYLMQDAWAALRETRRVVDLSPYAPEDAKHGADMGGRRIASFADVRAQGGTPVMQAVIERARTYQAEGKRVLIAAYSAGSCERIRTMLHDQHFDQAEVVQSLSDAGAMPGAHVGLAVLGLEFGFAAPDLAVIAEQDVFGERLVQTTRRKRRKPGFLTDVSTLNVGDLIVHADHGIGRYDGLERIEVGGAPHECVRLIYDGGDKLFVPVENVDVLTRFGADQGDSALDKLGGAGWQNRKARVKKRLKDLADELMKVAAARVTHKTPPIQPPEGLYQEFAARFPYAETEDQQRAIEDVIEDLDSGQPMDRLICGDVGFGKTEVALRAALVVASAGQQVAVVVPTTLLARQHIANFKRRFAGFGLNVGGLSRLVTSTESKAIKEGLESGVIDIVIGTHALLSESIKFKNLGLVIVDEEQHFGVKQKERLKKLRANVHVLTLTATPIPRTLQLSLTGLRELSLITTPPVDRLAVRTVVLPYDPVTVREALMREHFRGGQSFYVCPRVEDIAKLEERLKDLVPELKTVSAHGQMSATMLGERMEAFDDGQFDILLATNIIESGLDIPRANTMIIHRADLFGLAQLYQLRGRIGRSKLRGYAYFTYEGEKGLGQTAQQRLHVIETLDTLGAGFQLASYDMDIRGAGNLLGEEQSGHIREVGIELYQQLLEEAVAAAKSGAKNAPEENWTPQISLGLPVLIPDDFVPDLNVRLSLYRRLADLQEEAEVDGFAAELVDRFGKLPEEVENLLKTMALKRLCRRARVERLDAGPKGAVITFRQGGPADLGKLVAWVAKKQPLVKLRPDQKLVAQAAWNDHDKRLKGVERLMRELASLSP